MYTSKSTPESRPLFVAVNQRGKRTFLNSKNILHMESSGNYTTIHADGQRPVMVAKVLKRYQQLLENYGFMRINNSVLINSTRIREIYQDGCIVMENESRFYTSRRRKSVLASLICTIFLFMVASVSAQIGRVGINTTTPAAMLHVKDSSVVFTGGAYNLSSPTPVSGMGARMMWFPARQAFRVGYVSYDQWNTENIGFRSFAHGFDTRATGECSIAMGWAPTASGTSSIAFGNSATASGTVSVSIGAFTLASGWYSFASGFNTQATGHHSFATNALTVASGVYSFASGNLTKASGESSFAAGGNSTASAPYAVAFGNATANTHSLFAVGLNNDTTATNQNWSDSDHLFVIGNGSSDNMRRNAVTVLKGGNVGIATSNPKSKLHITGGADANVANPLSGYAVFGLTTADNVVIDNNEILARNNSASSTLYLQSFAGDLSLCDGNTGQVGIGNSNPDSKLQITNGSDAGPLSNGYLQLGLTNTSNIVFDDNEILARNGVNTADLSLQRDGGDLLLVELSGKVGIGNNNPGSKLHVTGGSLFTNYTSPGYANFGPTNGINLVLDPQNIVARNNGGPALLLLQAIGGDLSLCSSGGKVGIGSTALTEELNVAGDGIFTGNVTALAFNTSSDIRYKTNIQPIENALASVLKLHGITYDWNKDKFPEKEFNDRHQIGISAQELESIYPEMVFTDDKGYKTVDYSRLTPVLIEAVKEQQVQIERLTQKVDMLLEAMAAMTSVKD